MAGDGHSVHSSCMDRARRSALKQFALAGMAVSLARTVKAEDPHLSVKDPAARALGYVEEAAKVDAQKQQSYAAGQICENCLQLAGKDGASYRPCSVFPGKLVAARGWCSSWTPEI